jgi:hypothetical protein
VSERPCKVVAKDGKEMTLWEWPLPRSDNHWFDCLVGSAVAASMLGAAPSGLESEKPNAYPNGGWFAAQNTARRRT